VEAGVEGAAEGLVAAQKLLQTVEALAAAEAAMQVEAEPEAEAEAEAEAEEEAAVYGPPHHPSRQHLAGEPPEIGALREELAELSLAVRTGGGDTIYPHIYLPLPEGLIFSRYTEGCTTGCVEGWYATLRHFPPGHCSSLMHFPPSPLLRRRTCGSGRTAWA
jgi:hypothetical protein